MNDDDLLHDLGRMAREEDITGDSLATDDFPDPRWDALSAGTLTAEEKEKLRAEALATEAGRGAWEAFRDFDEDFRSQIVHRLAQERKAPGSTDRQPLEGPREAADEEPTEAPRNRAPRSRRRR